MPFTKNHAVLVFTGKKADASKGRLVLALIKINDDSSIKSVDEVVFAEEAFDTLSGISVVLSDDAASILFEILEGRRIKISYTDAEATREALCITIHTLIESTFLLF